MDNVVLNPGVGGQTISTDEIAGVQHQYVKVEFGVDGSATPVSTADPLPVTVLASVLPTDAATAANQQTDALTNSELRAAPVPVSGDFYPATQPVSGTVSVDNFPATQAVSGTVNVGNLPATQPVSGTVAVSNFPATQPISAASLPLPTGAATAANQQTDALTDTQLRATPVPVSGTVTANTGLTQPLTDTQLRASAVPVSIAATVAVKEVRSATPSQTSPSVTNSNTSILASNSNRLGATIYNEGAAICYMILGSTATTTSYTIQLQVGSYYELPFAYTGAIAGITSAGTAQLRVTELS